MFPIVFPTKSPFFHGFPSFFVPSHDHRSPWPGKIPVDEVLEALDEGDPDQSGPLPRRRFRSKALDKEGWAAWVEGYEGSGEFYVNHDGEDGEK